MRALWWDMLMWRSDSSETIGGGIWTGIVFIYQWKKERQNSRNNSCAGGGELLIFSLVNLLFYSNYTNIRLVMIYWCQNPTSSTKIKSGEDVKQLCSWIKYYATRKTEVPILKCGRQEGKYDRWLSLCTWCKCAQCAYVCVCVCVLTICGAPEAEHGPRGALCDGNTETLFWKKQEN